MRSIEVDVRLIEVDMSSRLSTGQAEGGPHAPEEAAPPPTVGFRVIIEDLVPIPEVTLRPHCFGDRSRFPSLHTIGAGRILDTRRNSMI